MIGIIGSEGFVGSALVRYAKHRFGSRVVEINRENFAHWSKAKLDWHLVIWAAGMSSKVKCSAYKDECWEQNVNILRDAINLFNPRKFVFLSSYDVYPQSSNPDESTVQALSDRYVASLSWYGMTKLAGEQVVKTWSESHQNYFILRCNGFTGPGLKKNAVFDLCSSPPRLFIAWESLIQYMHVDRFAKILFDLTKLPGSHTLNVTARDCVSPLDIMEIQNIKREDVLLPREGMLEFVHANMNVTKVEQLLNTQMPYSMEAVTNWNKPLFC